MCCCVVVCSGDSLAVCHVVTCGGGGGGVGLGVVECVVASLYVVVTVWWYATSQHLVVVVVWVCQNSVVGAAEYGQSARVRSVGVSDVRTQGSKMRLKLVCFTLATGTGVVFVFRRVGVMARDQNRVGRSVRLIRDREILGRSQIRWYWL